MLQTCLLSFISAFLLVFLLSNRIRKQSIRQYDLAQDNSNPVDKHIYLLHRFFKLLLSFAVGIIFIYCFAPGYYLLLIPIASLDDPVINYTGILILLCSLGWLLFTQLRIQAFFRLLSHTGKNGPNHRRWIYMQTKIMSAAGIAVMLIGLFVTISNVFAIYLIIMALLGYVLQNRLVDTKLR